MLQLRKPTVADVPTMVGLMQPHILAERLLPRSTRQVAERLRDYLLAEEVDEDGARRTVGVASVSLVDTHLAELGALVGESQAVELDMVHHLLDEAWNMGVDQAFVLTDRPDLFEGVGFRRTRVQDIPEKRDRQCLRCPRLPRCRQVALTVSSERSRQAAK